MFNVSVFLQPHLIVLHTSVMLRVKKIVSVPVTYLLQYDLLSSGVKMAKNKVLIFNFWRGLASKPVNGS